jgi:hypothetical protein
MHLTLLVKLLVGLPLSAAAAVAEKVHQLLHLHTAVVAVAVAQELKYHLGFI